MRVLPMAANLRPNLTKSEKKLCDTLLNDPELFIYYSITDLSKKISISSATIVRFAQKFGFNGYQEFKLALAKEITKDTDDRNDVFTGPINKDDSIEIIAKKFYKINIQALENTMSLMNYDEISKVAQMILSAKKVHFIGIGYSGITALDTKYKFMRTGIDTDAYTDGHTMIMMSAIMNKNDVVFAISNSGNTEDVIKSLILAKKNGLKTICITGSMNSRITAYTDAVITYSTTETKFQTGSVVTKIAQSFVIDLIYTQVARNCVQFALNKKKTTQALDI